MTRRNANEPDVTRRTRSRAPIEPPAKIKMRNVSIIAHRSLANCVRRQPDNNMNLRRRQLFEEGGLSTTPSPLSSKHRCSGSPTSVRCDADFAPRALTPFNGILRSQTTFRTSDLRHPHLVTIVNKRVGRLRGGRFGCGPRLGCNFGLRVPSIKEINWF